MPKRYSGCTGKVSVEHMVSCSSASTPISCYRHRSTASDSCFTHLVNELMESVLYARLQFVEGFEDVSPKFVFLSNAGEATRATRDTRTTRATRILYLHKTSP